MTTLGQSKSQDDPDDPHVCQATIGLVKAGLEMVCRNRRQNPHNILAVFGPKSPTGKGKNCGPGPRCCCFLIQSHIAQNILTWILNQNESNTKQLVSAKKQTVLWDLHDTLPWVSALLWGSSTSNLLYRPIHLWSPLGFSFFSSCTWQLSCVETRSHAGGMDSLGPSGHCQVGFSRGLRDLNKVFGILGGLKGFSFRVWGVFQGFGVFES